MKLCKTVLLTIMLVLLIPLSASASVKVLVDGASLESNNEPVFISGKLMVPMRSIFESLGAKVDFNNGNINAILGDTVINLTINQTACKINYKPDVIPVPPIIHNGSTLVPLRFVSQALQADVDYLAEHQVVLITSPTFKNALKSDDDALKNKVKKYNDYKNLTMTRETSTANYRKLEANLHKNVDILKETKQSIEPLVLNQNAAAIQIAIDKVTSMKGLEAEIAQLVKELNKDSLTGQLSKDLQSYNTLVHYVYKNIAEEKKINNVVVDKIKEAITLEQQVAGQIIAIEQKLKNDIETDRKGVQ